MVLRAPVADTSASALARAVPAGAAAPTTRPLADGIGPHAEVGPGPHGWPRVGSGGGSLPPAGLGLSARQPPAHGPLL